MLRQTRQFLLPLTAILLVIGAVQYYVTPSSEPFFNNDETRHVMTGVYVHDFLRDLPLSRPKDHVVAYYLQYPALGLLVWPPCFYVIEGLAMSVFGTSFEVGRGLIALFGVVGLAYFFALVRRLRSPRDAALATLLLALCPLVFLFSHQVMLEVPMLALMLAAIFHFQRYLEEAHRLDLFLTSVASALAALTRYDAVVLLPFFAILIIARRRLDLLRRLDVLLAVALALALTAPYYVLAFYYYRTGLYSAAIEGVDSSGGGFLKLANLSFYLTVLPEQVSWFLLVPATLGLVAATVQPEHRRRSWTILALFIATYVTFTPLAELEARHALAWVPAIVVFAVDGLGLLAGRVRSPVVWILLATVMVGGTAWTALHLPACFVRGYEDAARHVVSNTQEAPIFLFDGAFGGNFILQVRRHDVGRKCTVLRADHVLYRSLNESGSLYEEYAETEQKMLDLIEKLAPDHLVVETPRAAPDSPASQKLRATLDAHPDRFQRERTIPILTNVPCLRGVVLQIYRNLDRTSHARRHRFIGMPSIGRSLETGLPGL